MSGATNALADPAENAAATIDRGGWMQTFTGRAYHHARPQLRSIHLNDIAHALGMICRFGGHTSRFYSVAEHSVLVSQCVPKEHAFVALMHDATEAYVGDMARPLKHAVGRAYTDLEHTAWLAICDEFDMDPELPACVHEADNAVLLAERDALMVLPPPYPWTWAAGLKPAPVQILGLMPPDAKALFRERFWELA